MKKLFLFILIIPVFLFSQEVEKNEKKLIHVVLLKFKDKADIDLFGNESYKYLSTIEGVNNFLFSKNISPEGKIKALLMPWLCSLILNLIEILSIYHIRNIFLLLKNTGDIM